MATDAWAAIGTVTEQTGPTEIQRDKQSIPSAQGTGVEMNDAVVTARAKVGITFEDDTKVEISEQSKLVIDDFVYDPSNKDAAGKLAMKVAMGTARYASGQIAKDAPQNVKIDTPTATIAVRGTDFTMTVDELGRSLVILLPSCPKNYKNIDKDCVTGQIDVITDTGVEHLDKPFQATMTKSKEQNPTKSVILKLDPIQINNMLILSPPNETRSGEAGGRTALDINFLDKDLLKFDGLNADFFALSSGKLDINYLDQAFLANMLDLLNAQLLADMLAVNPDDTLLPRYSPANKNAGLKYVKDDTNVTLYKSGTSSYAEISIDMVQNAQVIITQDAYTVTQQVNGGNNTSITVTQSK